MNALLVAQGRMAVESGEARALRERCRLPRRVVAEHLGVSVYSIVKWENRQSLPNAEHAEAYALLLDELRAELDRGAA
jgi:DNA-binding transcriptional regulator YiaG